MIKMLDFTNIEWVEEREIAIDDEWLDDILNGHTEEEIIGLCLQHNCLSSRRGNLTLSVVWSDGTSTLYSDYGGHWCDGVHFV
ncbi:hypothetical protein [Granulicatella balaenopterae]|nr:hypothetical protein [Granulicatella balaenopterae]